MRLKVDVTENGQVTETLVPLATFLAFPASHDGRNLNDALEGDDFTLWQPWVAWHAATHLHGDTRTYDEYVAAIEWVEASNVDGADPSGGEASQTQPSSPASSSEPHAPGQSS